MTARLITPQALLDILRQADDGLTLPQLSKAAGYASPEGAASTLRGLWAEQRCHIDRWVRARSGVFAPVYMAGRGEDCPMPERKQ